MAARLRRLRAVLHGGRTAVPRPRPARRGSQRALVLRPYAFPAVKHEPRIEQLSDILRGEGLHPFHLPLGIKLDQNPDGSATTYSPCIRCDAFDGFPCAVNAKADAQVICVDPTKAAHPNFTLLTGAYVTRLETDPSGRSVKRVVVLRDGKVEHYSADIVVAACGALSTAC